MSRLTKGMFGTEFSNTSHLFGLSCGQMRGAQIVHNGGWYNAKGEKLGWGDLGSEDFRKLQHELRDDELFIVLSESDSFWNFVRHNPGTIGSDCRTEPTESAPGPAYVAEKCSFILTKGRALYVDRYRSYQGQASVKYRDRVTCEVVSPEAAAALIRRR
jgi:hypothetical protein